MREEEVGESERSRNDGEGHFCIYGITAKNDNMCNFLSSPWPYLELLGLSCSFLISNDSDASNAGASKFLSKINKDISMKVQVTSSRENKFLEKGKFNSKEMGFQVDKPRCDQTSFSEYIFSLKYSNVDNIFRVLLTILSKCTISAQNMTYVIFLHQ